MEAQTTADSEINRLIMDATISGDVRQLLQLLVGDVEPTEEKTEDTPDKWASYLENVMQPVKMRPDIQTVNFTDKESGNTPLHYAAARNKIDCVGILLRCDGVQVNAQNNEKQTPLHLAVKEDNVQIVHMLLQKRARFDIPDNKEETPLSIAVAQQREACSKLMIEFGADVSVLYATAVHEEPHTEAYDRYGFLIPKDTPAHPKLDKSSKILLDKEDERVPKWNKMLNKCRLNLEKEKPKRWKGYPHRKLKNRVRKGIPNEVRGAAWMILSGADLKKKQNEGIYQSSLKQASVHVKQIDLDINRCYRDNRMFQQRYGKGQVALFNVLKAYSNYNPTLGYCQGMATITAMFLLYLQEEDAFWLLATVLSDEKYGLAGCFLDGFPRLMESFYIHERIIEAFLPKLHKHMKRASLETSMYATRWYMQVMLDILPFEAAVHVWDLYISEGRKVIFSTTLAIFKLHENVLKKYEFDEMIRYLNRLEFTDCDVEELMKITTKQKIKHKKIHGFETLYEKEQKSKAQRKN